MHIVETIILGIVQGLTEFIPISSSGHLVIAQYVFSGASEHLLLEFINIGTFLALVVYFRRRIVKIARDVYRERNIKLLRNIIITSVPAGAIGFFAADFIGSNWFFASLVVVMVSMFVFGVIMVIIEKLPRASKVLDGEFLSPKRALFIGIMQVLALIPGVSRSGSTIIAGRFAGLPAAAAAEYSFLASLPIMLGVTVKTLIGDHDYLADYWLPLLLGNVAAFFVGLLAVGFLIRYLSRHSLALFGWYRIALSTVLLVIVLVQ